VLRRLLTAFGAFAILIAPSIGDFLARGTDACAVARCCIGKMSRSCPMHPRSSQHGFGMRSCSSDDSAAATHQTIVTLSAPRKVRTIVIVKAIPQIANAVHKSPETLPPDPPPPRTA
jgi:hypothetical protein